MPTATRWVSLAQLVAETGLATRTLQYIAQREPGVLVTRERGGQVQYKQPDCAVHLRNRERDLAKAAATRREEPADYEKARARKMAAEAMLAEIELATARGQLVPLDVAEATAAELADRLRAVLINLPANYGLALERAGLDQIAAEAVLTGIADELTRALRGVADALDDEADRGDSGESSDAA